MIDAIFFTRTNIERHMVNGHISYADFYQLFQNEMTYKYYFNLMSDMAPNWPFNRAHFLSALRGSDDLSATANAYGIPANLQINWSRILNPLAGVFPRIIRRLCNNILKTTSLMRARVTI